MYTDSVQMPFRYFLAYLIAFDSFADTFVYAEYVTCTLCAYVYLVTNKISKITYNSG